MNDTTQIDEAAEILLDILRTLSRQPYKEDSQAEATVVAAKAVQALVMVHYARNPVEEPGDSQ